MNCNLEKNSKLSFKKGMTLSEYMKQMNSDLNQPTSDMFPQPSEDLYLMCSEKPAKHASKKLIPFNIPEMDQDNYQSSVDYCYQQAIFKSRISQSQRENETPKFRQTIEKKQKQSIPKIEIVKIQKSTDLKRQNSKEYNIRQQSNSPFKKEYEYTPTKSPFSKTLYGNKFLSNNLTNMNTASSTFYQSKLVKGSDKLKDERQGLKGSIHSRESKNEKYFQNKNRRQLHNLIQYENSIKNKYNQKINIFDIRIDGFRDKLCDRKNRIFH